MYQDNYPYGYPDPYMNEISNFRQLANQVGSFITVLNNIPLGGGYTIPSGTRVFIHSVRLDAAGNELVTIVFPQIAGGNCIAGSTEVLGSALTAPSGPVHHHHMVPRSYPTYL
jgi:hypothetical protein